MLPSVLHPTLVQDLARQWLREDTPNFDFGGAAVGEQDCKAAVFCKSDGILAGIPFVNAVFSELGCSVKWHKEEGQLIPNGTVVATTHGKARCLLLAERVILNCLARASGVATTAYMFKECVVKHGWSGRVAGTRKTTPGFRLVEKYALLVGGVDMHRHDLSGMIMLKDNHIWLNGSISKAIAAAQKVGGFSQKIEVECRSLEEALEAGNAGCDVIMLDNFSPDELHLTAARIKSQYPCILIEASGKVTIENVDKFVGPDIDIISTSSLIQGYKCLDFSMKIIRKATD